MVKRRPLTVGVNTVPDADPEVVHEFVRQERHVDVDKNDENASELKFAPPPKPELSTTPRKRPKRKANGVNPVGLIPVTVRLRPELAGALKRASLERQLSGEEPNTQQELVESALEPWLRDNGFLP